MNSLDMTMKDTGSEFQVSARALHEWLGVKKRFSDWIAYQIERVKIAEGRDYIEVYPKFGINSAGRPAHEYMLTLRAAQHIGMMANTERGFAAREYFLNCEEKLKEVSKPKEIQQPKSSLDILMAQYEMVGLMLQNQIDLQSRVSILEARSDINDNYVTISGFLSLKKIKGKTGEEIRVLGMQVAKYCKENGIKIAKVPDARRGEVNAYPKEVLEMLIGDAA